MIVSRLNPASAIGSIVLGIVAAVAIGSTAVAEPVDTISVDAGSGGGPSAARGVEDRATRGNPLWAIPIKDLSMTRERPIFSPSRRPLPPPVVAAPYVPPPAPPKPVEPERPQLALVGTIAGDDEAFGIFLDQTTNTVVRLKLGDHHRGWMLRQVVGREVVLQKDGMTSVLALPSPDTKSSAVGTRVADDPASRRARR